MYTVKLQVSIIIRTKTLFKFKILRCEVTFLWGKCNWVSHFRAFFHTLLWSLTPILTLAYPPGPSITFGKYGEWYPGSKVNDWPHAGFEELMHGWFLHQHKVAAHPHTHSHSCAPLHSHSFHPCDAFPLPETSIWPVASWLTQANQWSVAYTRQHCYDDRPHISPICYALACNTLFLFLTHHQLILTHTLSYNAHINVLLKHQHESLILTPEWAAKQRWQSLPLYLLCHLKSSPICLVSCHCAAHAPDTTQVAVLEWGSTSE